MLVLQWRIYHGLAEVLLGFEVLMLELEVHLGLLIVIWWTSAL